MKSHIAVQASRLTGPIFPVDLKLMRDRLLEQRHSHPECLLNEPEEDRILFTTSQAVDIPFHLGAGAVVRDIENGRDPCEGRRENGVVVHAGMLATHTGPEFTVYRRRRSDRIWKGCYVGHVWVCGII
jgi:hypothetical protein